MESYPGLDLTFGGYSQWNGRYVAVEPNADFTNAAQYDIIDRSKPLWTRPDLDGVLGWSSSSQFPNTWIYAYFNGAGTSVYGQITCSGQYNPDPTQCNLQSSGSGLNSITAVSPTGSGTPGSAPTNQPTNYCLRGDPIEDGTVLVGMPGFCECSGKASVNVALS